MSERYTRVFSLPENLYATGSPVIISAGALLKDNQTGKVLAQLKLTNIQYKKIKAVKVKLFPQDTMGQPLGDAAEYQYLDLQITRDADFGSKTPIVFPDATTRSFAAEVTAVVFADNTAWHADGSSWEQIPDRVALHQKYDNLVIAQLRLEQSGTCQFVVQEHQDLWLCTCGAVNHDGEVRCHDCGKQLSQIHPLDVDGLTKRAKQRLAEEARQVAEEKAAREAAIEATKKKTTRILKIAIPIVCILIALVILFNTVIIPNNKYKNAISLMDAGQFEEAVAVFEVLDGYKDSTEKIAKCEDAIAEAEREKIFAYAEELLEKKQYIPAAEQFAMLGNYRDSIQAAAYCTALAEIEAGNDSIAKNILDPLVDYRDAKQYIEEFIWRPVTVTVVGCSDPKNYASFPSYNIEYNTKGDIILENDDNNILSVDGSHIVEYDLPFSVVNAVCKISNVQYNEAGRVIQFDQTQYGRDYTHTIEYLYDSNDRIIKRIETKYKGSPNRNNFQEKIITDYNYNQFGQITRAKQNAKSGKHTEEYVYSYNDNGDIISATCTGDYSFLRDGWVFETYFEYEYGYIYAPDAF